MQNYLLESLLNQALNTATFDDYVVNGLQVEGRSKISKIVTGVTASQALLDAAVAHQADAVLVHHGYFWKNEAPEITGIKRKRLKTLLANDINLYAYHLPLDAHPALGNNAQIAKLLQILPVIPGRPDNLLWEGTMKNPIVPFELREQMETVFRHEVLHCDENAPEMIRRIAWCSGGGQSFIEKAAKLGVDAFLTGEVSEWTIHVAREYGIHFFAAGHHATERFGVKALGAWLAEYHKLEVIFVDIDNPA